MQLIHYTNVLYKKCFLNFKRIKYFEDKKYNYILFEYGCGGYLF